ncbi:hypothetical protein HQN90_06195 [Paenibacillus alba]|uniref:hypothetical protein n=1 Tax=Paenibacillus alba TaxID=1197127 RepID=UPI00156690F2|nr:hypothetical protein [Paenibacillus alba]NQX65712.1 hypothetical protein [Paenibacillus alba]
MAKAIVTLIDGLPLKNSKSQLEITFDNDYLIISETIAKGFKMVVDNTFKIPLANFLESTVTTEKEIVSQSKSVIGRGIVGGVLFGPAGLLLGGMSGIGDKKKTKVSDVYIVSYLSSAEEVRNITFTMPPLMVSVTKKFDKDLKERMKMVQLSEGAQRILGSVSRTETIL